MNAAQLYAINWVRMEFDQLQTRREMVETLGRAVAVPGASLFFTAWLRGAPTHVHGPASGAPPDPNLLRDYRPAFFAPPDFEALQAFTEILIPTDETPGAREAHCAHFIDFVLQATPEPSPTRTQWRDALTALERAGFHPADGQRRLALVGEMARPEREAGANHPAFGAYRLIKQQTAFAFYTSRVGMIETLDYKGNSYNLVFPACDHPEHHRI